MPTDTANYSVDNKTMQLYMDLLDPHLTLNDVLNVTAYAVMGCGKDYQFLLKNICCSLYIYILPLMSPQ